MTQKDSMTIEVYAYFDNQGKQFDVPFFARTDLQAKRRFQIEVETKPDSVLSRFINDFDLYYLGQFDVVAGLFQLTDDGSPSVPRLILAGKSITKG